MSARHYCGWLVFAHTPVPATTFHAKFTCGFTCLQPIVVMHRVPARPKVYNQLRSCSDHGCSSYQKQPLLTSVLHALPSLTSAWRWSLLDAKTEVITAWSLRHLSHLTPPMIFKPTPRSVSIATKSSGSVILILVDTWKCRLMRLVPPWDHVWTQSAVLKQEAHKVR